MDKAEPRYSRPALGHPCPPLVRPILGHTSMAGIIEQKILSGKPYAPYAVFEPRVLSLPGHSYSTDGFDTSMYPTRVPASLPGISATL